MLLVEDNEKVAEITAALLQELGCRTKRARNADEALEIFTNGGIDLVLIDIVMPGGVNGLDLARNLRDQLPVRNLTGAAGWSRRFPIFSPLDLSLLTTHHRF